MVFPVVMCSCDWTIKKAECQRIYAFELWCWRRHLNVPWTTRRSNQSIWREINPEYSLEGLMLKLKPVFAQYDAHRWLIGKVPDAGKDRWQKEKRVWKWDEMASPMQWTWTWTNSRRYWGTGRPGVLQTMGLQRVGHNWATEQHSIVKRKNWSSSVFRIIST